MVSQSILVMSCLFGLGRSPFPTLINYGLVKDLHIVRARKIKKDAGKRRHAVKSGEVKVDVSV